MSRVAHFALVLLDWHESQVVKPGERVDMVRAAVVASGMRTAEAMFPEYAPKPTADSLMAGDNEAPEEVRSTEEPDDALAFIRSFDAMTFEGAGVLSFDDLGGE